MFEIIIFLIAVAFYVLVIAIFLNRKNKMDSKKVVLCLLSLLTIILISLTPNIGYRIDSNFGYVYVGFPAEMLVYRGDWVLTFTSFGLIFNFFFFYWSYKLILKISKVFIVKSFLL